MSPIVAVIIVGMGRVPEALLGASKEVLGPLEAVSCLGVESPLDPATLRERTLAALMEADQGRGVLFLADLCGSSLINACYDLAASHPEVEVLCGANLAMLMKLYSVDRRVVGPTELARQLAESGRRGINLASDRFLVLDPTESE